MTFNPAAIITCAYCDHAADSHAILDTPDEKPVCYAHCAGTPDGQHEPDVRSISITDYTEDGAFIDINCSACGLYGSLGHVSITNTIWT